MKKKVVGATLLVAGSCIGAGMLGIPLVSAAGGFIPSLFLFLFAWLFMTVSGLILAEVQLRSDPSLHLLGLSQKYLGRVGGGVTCLTFLFLFGSLNIAYISAGGELLSRLLPFSLTTGHSSLFLALFTGLFVYLGTNWLEGINRLFVALLLMTYLLMLSFGLEKVHLSNIVRWGNHLDFSVAFPTMVISFGYHNLIPTLARYLEGNVKSMRMTILVGTLIPLVVYLLWNFVVLGSMGEREIFLAQSGNFQLLDLFGDGGLFPFLKELFAFFALLTSFFGVTLSFVDFLADALWRKGTDRGGPRAFLTLLALIPPLLIAAVYHAPFLFFLSKAGVYGALVLFGVLPALMRFSIGWREGGPSFFPNFPRLPIYCTLLISLFVIAMNLIP